MRSGSRAASCVCPWASRALASSSTTSTGHWRRHDDGQLTRSQLRVTFMRARTPLTVLEALLPLLALISLLIAGAVTVGLTGELLVTVLLIAAATAGLVAARHGVTWEDIQRSTGEKIAAVLPALLIMLAIGMLIATWVLSGTIPWLVYWGVRLVRPELLIVTAF